MKHSSATGVAIPGSIPRNGSGIIWYKSFPLQIKIVSFFNLNLNLNFYYF